MRYPLSRYVTRGRTSAGTKATNLIHVSYQPQTLKQNGTEEAGVHHVATEKQDGFYVKGRVCPLVK
jgi:hypothetical protein